MSEIIKDENCLFCKIIEGSIPSTKVYEDDTMLAFRDINPVAPVHILMLPKNHIASANDITNENSSVISHIFVTASKIAKKLGISEDGYRIVNNCGENGGQTVKHLHFHLIGGKKLSIDMG